MSWVLGHLLIKTVMITDTDKPQVLLPLSSSAASFVRWGINRSLQWYVFTPLNRQ